MLLTVQMYRDDLPDEEINYTDFCLIGGARQGTTMTITTTETDIEVRDSISYPGLCYVRNYSDTVNQYVDLGYQSGNYSHRLYEGETALIPLNIGIRHLYAKANTGSLKFEYEITERTGVITSGAMVDTDSNRMIWTDGSYWTWKA